MSITPDNDQTALATPPEGDEWYSFQQGGNIALLVSSTRLEDGSY